MFFLKISFWKFVEKLNKKYKILKFLKLFAKSFLKLFSWFQFSSIRFDFKHNSVIYFWLFFCYLREISHLHERVRKFRARISRRHQTNHTFYNQRRIENHRNDWKFITWTFNCTNARTQKELFFHRLDLIIDLLILCFFLFFNSFYEGIA